MPDIGINNNLFHNFNSQVLQLSGEWLRIFCYSEDITLKTNRLRNYIKLYNKLTATREIQRKSKSNKKTSDNIRRERNTKWFLQITWKLENF